jgi:hypothetical protein
MAATIPHHVLPPAATRQGAQASTALSTLAALSGALALIAALAGLLWPGTGDPVPFTTVRGQTVLLYGQGLYRHDTLFSAGAFKGSDLLVLGVVLPLLLIGILSYRRGSLRGALLLAGALSYLLYNSASMAFGAAFNPLFLVYVALFSASLFAFITVLSIIDRTTLPAYIGPRMPRRAAAAVLFIVGPGTAALWLTEMMGALLAGEAPAGLGSYTTLFTHGLDMAVIAPASVLAGVLLLRRHPLGYVLGVPILVLCTLIGPMVILQTVMQLRVGVAFSTTQVVVMIGGFVAMGLLAAVVTVAVLRQMHDVPRQ